MKLAVLGMKGLNIVNNPPLPTFLEVDEAHTLQTGDRGVQLEQGSRAGHQARHICQAAPGQTQRLL